MTFKTLSGAGLLSILLLVGGCGPKKPMITQQQVSDARSAGTLEQLYNKVNQDMATAGSSEKKSLQALASQIAEQLAADAQQKIYQTIEDNRLPGGVAPLTLLNQLKNDAESIKAWSSQRYNDTRQKVGAESTLSQDALSQQLLEIGQINLTNPVERINAMSVAAKISGKGSQYDAQFEREKEQVVVNWMVEADTALANRQYSHAATFLRKVLGVDPGNKEAAEKLTSSQQQGFETAFRKALEDSKPELAFSELLRIADSPMFESVKGTLTSSIQLLNDFFVNRALQATSQGALKGGYESFAKARKIRAIMGLPLKSDAEHNFMKKATNFAKSLGSQKRYGEQLAYLEIVYEFDPEFDDIAVTLEAARKTIIEYASTSLFVKDFEQTGTHHSAGKSLAQNTYSWIFNKMPGEIALVSVAQLAQSDTSAPGRLLTLEGAILQAGVDTENTNGQKTMRVVTETTRTPNPEFAKWKKDQSRGPAPEEFLISEKKEDVTVNVTYARKTGILSASYRLIDQKSGQVLINETARDKQLFEQEGNEGVNIGEFNMPFKRPELPSDIEIMEKLTTVVAQQIGDKLKQMLQNPDNRYEEMGDAAISQNQYDAAKDYFGYAMAIRSAKQGDVHSLKSKLINSVIKH